MLIFGLLIWFKICLICYGNTKSAKLTPKAISSLYDISVVPGYGTTILEDTWNIHVIEQQQSDLHIELGTSWGFHPYYPSTIELFMIGNTSIKSYNDDSEILFVFSVDNQYFAEMISLDSILISYRECPHSHKSLIIRNVSEMINSPLPDRYYRYCNNSAYLNTNYGTDYWGIIQPIYKKSVEWPMFMRITNNPITNTLQYHWGDFGGNGKSIKVTSSYSSSFETNHGFNVYISGDSQHEEFNIFSIDVKYYYEVPDSSQMPSISPITIQPTTIPMFTPYKISTTSTTTADTTTVDTTTGTTTAVNRTTAGPIKANLTTGVPTNESTVNIDEEITSYSNQELVFTILALSVMICAFIWLIMGFILCRKQENNQKTPDLISIRTTSESCTLEQDANETTALKN